MNEAMDWPRRQMALTALTTESFNLQTARMGTISEANGRSTLYLGTLSSAVIALAFIGQASDSFYVFALTLLPSVFLLGVFSYLRLVQTSVEDMVYAVASIRIREYFVNLDPGARSYFPPTDLEGLRTLERMGFLPTGRLQPFLTAASMIACINSIVGGIAVAVATSALNASAVVAALSGGLVALVFVTLSFVYQIRRFQRAAAGVPEMYKGQGAGVPWWSKGLEDENP